MRDLDLLEDLRQDGQVDSTGRFTLDAAKAREKMKRYQLPDPHQYVLQVVQSAVAGGATVLDVLVDADDCWINYDATPPTSADLQGLFNHLFGSGRDPEERSLRALATGLNSALALDPSWIRLEAWDGRQGRTLLMEAGGEQITPFTPPSGQPPGVRIHVRRRHTWRVLGRFLRGIVAMHPEARALHDRCRWSPVPIQVNGRRVEPGTVASDALLTFEVEGPGYRAALALPRGLLERSILEVVMDGVTFEAGPLDLGPLAVRGVVWTNALARNVSQTAVAEDSAWRQLLLDLRKHVRALLGQLAGLGQVQTPPPGPSASRARAAQDSSAPPELTAHLLRAMVRQGLRADQDWRRWKELKQALLDVAAFPLVGGGFTSLRCLLTQFEEIGRLPESRPADGAPLLVPVMEGQYAVVLRSVFPQAGRRDRSAAPARPPGQRGAAAPPQPEASPRRGPSPRPRTSSRPAPGPPVAVPLPEQDEPGPMEEALLASLRALLERLRGPDHPEISDELLGSLEMGRTPPGVVWSCSPGGRQATLNRSHPVVRRLLSQEPALQAELYALVSSLYTSLSRAAPGLGASRGRSFHACLLMAAMALPELQAD